MPSEDSDPSCDRSNINMLHIRNKRCIPQSDRQKLVQIKRNLAYGDSQNEKGWWEQRVEGMLCLSRSKLVDIKGGRTWNKEPKMIITSKLDKKDCGCHIYHKFCSATHLPKKPTGPQPVSLAIKLLHQQNVGILVCPGQLDHVCLGWPCQILSCNTHNAISGPLKP